MLGARCRPPRHADSQRAGKGRKSANSGTTDEVWPAFLVVIVPLIAAVISEPPSWLNVMNQSVFSKNKKFRKAGSDKAKTYIVD